MGAPKGGAQKTHQAPNVFQTCSSGLDRVRAGWKGEDSAGPPRFYSHTNRYTGYKPFAPLIDTLHQTHLLIFLEISIVLKSFLRY